MAGRLSKPGTVRGSRSAGEGSVAEAIPFSIRQMAEEEGEKAGIPMAEAFQVRGLGILENIKDLIGGLSVMD